MRLVLRWLWGTFLSVLSCGVGFAQFGSDCPTCNYSFPGPVPPPRVGGVATGSGFVVHPEGYVLTNYHVVEGSTTVKVVVGGKEYTATVVESLPARDLALVKIDARGLPAVALGNSDRLEIGDDVFAIGCPGGVCGTVTAGRVANVGVSIEVEGGKRLDDLLMVDVIFDHGSSGGPLVNSRGEVVGVTTAISGQTRFGFAVPINQAIPLLRRVPGFSVSQMGRATRELTFREIRDGITPLTTFILTDQGRPLQLPSRYDTSKWPQSSGGRTCRYLWDLPGDKRCYLDDNVPPGFTLLGYLEGVADEQNWSRSFPSLTDKRVSFGQKVGVWIIQFDTAAAARAAAKAYCCPERVWDKVLTRVYAEGRDCTRCMEGRSVIVSTRSARHSVEIVRTVTVHTTQLFVATSSDPLSASYSWWYGKCLSYSMIATLETYVIVLVVQASLSSEDPLVLWVNESGLRIERVVVIGSAPPPYVAMSYDAFIKWATERETELLDFILRQF